MPKSLLLSLVEPLHFPELMESGDVMDALGEALLHLHATHEFATPDRPPGLIMLLAHPDFDMRRLVIPPILPRETPAGLIPHTHHADLPDGT